MTEQGFERWVDAPGRDVRACVLRRPFVFESPFGAEPFALLLVVCDAKIKAEEQFDLCDAIVASPCCYVMCAGRDCELWHDVIDESDDGSDPDPDRAGYLTTTWHDGLSPAATVRFMFQSARHEGVPYERYLVAFVRGDPSEREQWRAAVLALTS
jgi:hypothetical protein